MNRYSEIHRLYIFDYARNYESALGASGNNILLGS